MNAVSETDILTANIDYVAKGRELRARMQQQQPRRTEAVASHAAGVKQTAAASSAAMESPLVASSNNAAGPSEDVTADLGAKPPQAIVPCSSCPVLTRGIGASASWCTYWNVSGIFAWRNTVVPLSVRV